MNQIRAYRFWRKTYCREVQKVDDANGLCSVLVLVADMAAIPKTIGAVSDWREHDPLLTPEQGTRPGRGIPHFRRSDLQQKPSRF